MDQLFYIAVNGSQDGPYTYEQLKTKVIKKDTLIWTEGLDNWTKAEHVAILKDIIRKLPPPLENEQKKAASPPPPPVGNNASSEKYFGYELATRSERLFANIIETIIIIIPLLFLFGFAILDWDTFSLDFIIGSAVSAYFYGAICYPFFSGNLGHKIMGLKVISSVNGNDKNGIFIGGFREGLKSLTSNFVLPIIWLLWDKDNQNLYDKMMNTYVVRNK